MKWWNNEIKRLVEEKKRVWTKYTQNKIIH